MATARPFAYNTGAGITGTDQVGSLAVGTPTEGFSATGLEWWNGPDEDLGYVIAQSVPGDTQPTSFFSGQMSCSTIYKGANINLSNNNQTAFQQFGYQMSVLTNTFIDDNDKVMFSVLATSLAPTTLPQSRFIGVGKTTMNYQGDPYGGYPGNDTQSIGFNGIGDYYYNGSVVQSGLPTWASGKGSIAFAGTNQYISTTVSSAPGTDSATYEMWFYQTNNSPTTQGLLQTRTSTSGGDGIDASISFGQIQISTSGAFLLTAGSVSVNTWYHLAVVRNGTTAWTVYLNGTSIGTFNFANTTGTELSLGRKSATGVDEFFKGYITNFRYVKGVAVYTANFTPPTNSLASTQGSNINGSPSAAITGTQTQLLLNAFTNNFLKDSSSYNLTMSNPNGATSVTNSPFTEGDIVDIAISHGQGWFIRVNGGYWNNNPSANPTTLTGYLSMSGLTNFYPALCPGYEGTMTIQNNATYGVPEGYTLLGANVNASVGFFRSSDLTDPSFISLSNTIAGPSGGGPFASGSAAKTWLNDNGYWTSYVGATGATGATGDFNVTITQVAGPNVVWSGSGSFNLAALTLVGTTVITSGFQANNAIWIAGATSNAPGATGQQYGGASLTYPATFATGSPAILSIGATGSMFGVLTGGASGRTIVVPDGYVSGTTISGSTTYSGSTISSLGLSGGTYTWAWGSGANASSLVMVIGEAGSTGAAWYFYSAAGPPTNNGNVRFVNAATGITYNPNNSGGEVLDFYFNSNQADGTSYLTQFNALDASGGTVAISQGANTVIYQGDASVYTVSSSSGYSSLRINTFLATLIQPSSTLFTEGAPITIAIS
jgi:hypothetical protein